MKIAAGTSAQANLNLRESNPLELALQLTDPEWMASFPLTDQQKFELRDCSRCHTLQRVAMSTYNKDQLAWVMKRMLYSAGSTPMTFQLPAGQTATWGRAEWGEPSAMHKRQAEIVAAINLSNGMWKYELKKSPRPKGKETQVIYTTYELPVTHRPMTHVSVWMGRSGTTISTTMPSRRSISRPGKRRNGAGPTALRRDRLLRPGRAR